MHRVAGRGGEGLTEREVEGWASGKENERRRGAMRPWKGYGGCGDRNAHSVDTMCDKGKGVWACGVDPDCQEERQRGGEREMHGGRQTLGRQEAVTEHDAVAEEIVASCIPATLGRHPPPPHPTQEMRERCVSLLI